VLRVASLQSSRPENRRQCQGSCYGPL